MVVKKIKEIAWVLGLVGAFFLIVSSNEFQETWGKAREGSRVDPGFVDFSKVDAYGEAVELLIISLPFFLLGAALLISYRTFIRREVV